MDRSSVSVRGLAAIAAACALFCLGAASASAAPLLFSANATNNSVSVIDTATNQVLGEPIGVGTHPFSIALTPDGRFAYVVNRFAGTVSVINVETRQVVGEPIPVGEDPIQVAVTPDGKFAWVANVGSENLSVIDTQANRVVRTIPTEGWPWGIAFTPDGKYAYAPLYNESAVEVIEVQTGRSLGHIATGERPFTVTFTPDGAKALVANSQDDSVTVIETATRRVVTTIPVGLNPWATAISPDGKRAYVANRGEGTISVIDTSTNRVVGTIPVGEFPGEISITPNGKTMYVAVEGSKEVVAFDLATDSPLGAPIPEVGGFALAMSPDQSPSAIFKTLGVATVGTPAAFSAAAPTDPDGSIAAWNWAFGDGGTATGSSVTHTFLAPGTYNVSLKVLDNEGCGEEQVFTGRTTYCSGGGLTAVHPVTVNPSPVVTAPVPPSNNFRFGRIVHNRHNGTVRLQVKLPSAGYVLLFGKKVHAVTRKSKGVQMMWLTLHARVELAKRLKTILRAPVKFRVTFTPNGGTAKTVHRSVTLLRAPRHKHGH